MFDQAAETPRNTVDREDPGVVAVGLPGQPEGPEVLSAEALPNLTGRCFTGGWFVIDPQAHDQFCQATFLDRVYPPADPEDPLADVIEGFYLLSLLDALVTTLFHVDPGVGFGLNYGLDRVRFITPVSRGDELRLICEVTDVTKKNEGHLVTTRCTLERAGSDRPAMVAYWLFLVLAKSKGPPL